MRLSVNNENEANIMILICIIGLLESLENNLISIEEGEQFLFSPYSVYYLKKGGIDENIVKLVELGTELEDIESLLPDLLKSKIKDLSNSAKKLLKEFRSISISEPYEIEKWIDKKDLDD